jgi:heavy metal translocating P-type ATPase
MATRASIRAPLVFLPVSLLGLGIGGVAALGHHADTARLAWTIATLPVLAGATVRCVQGLVRREPGVDVLAVLGMAGALVVGEALAACIVALMLSTGAVLETWASWQARRELTGLLARAPRVAHRRVGEAVLDIPVDRVRPGDRLVVKRGEVVPVDGVLLDPVAVLDLAALTGESRPVEVHAGARLASGATNAGDSFEEQAVAAAEASTYARIVRLVKGALEHRAPLVRLADRYATAFVLVTLVIMGLAWALSGDPVRAVAVLVVATPCPLIIATPVAIVSGLSCAARHGAIVKSAGALETLARARVVLLDKTGTLTAGRPEVVEVAPFVDVPPDEILRLAASVEQLSAHPIAPAILSAAASRGTHTSYPSEVSEQLGAGIRGLVEGHRVAVGRLRWVGEIVPPGARPLQRRARLEGATAVFVGRDGVVIGGVLVRDPLRGEAPRALLALRRAGVRRILLVTGDQQDIAQLVGNAVGVDAVLAERTPEDKVRVVEAARADGPLVMVGDGINDAPALALADVGVAMGARGATAASEAASVVLVADRLGGLSRVVAVARRTRTIALQSIFAGIGLSLGAMGFAAVGRLPPVSGAILQEAIDLCVILNALRALRSPGSRAPKPATVRVIQTFQGEHVSLRPLLEALLSAAARLEEPGTIPELQALAARLEGELLPHELHEQEQAFPALARAMPSEDPTALLEGTHREIVRLVHLFSHLVDELPRSGAGPDELREVRRTLYGLHAVLALHNAQEDELYGALIEAE